MKRTRFIILILFTACISITNCNKEGVKEPSCSDSYSKTGSLTDAVGSIGFNNTTSQYFIVKYIDGAIDSFYTLYPCNLPEEYKQENLKVIFSGDLYTGNDLPNPQLGGQEIFHFDLKKIHITPVR